MVLGFPERGVSGRHQHGGIAARPVRPIKVGGDEITGEAFEDDLLQSVGRIGQAAGNPGVQRPMIIRQPADQLEEFCADPLSAAVGVSRVLDLRNRALSPRELLLRDLVHP